MTAAIAPLDGVSTWARGNLLVIVLLVLGAILLTRFAVWSRGRIMAHIDERADDNDELVRSEAPSTGTSSRRSSPGGRWRSSTS